MDANDDMDVAGAREPRVALVTGATDEPSRSIAVELARRGWSLFCQYRGDRESAEALLRDAAAAAARAGLEVELAVEAADVTSAGGREQLVENAVEEFDRVDLLVAGGPPLGAGEEDLLELVEDSWRSALEAGVNATLFLTQIVANEMVRLVEAGLIESPKIVLLNDALAGAADAGRAPGCVNAAATAAVAQLFADRLGEHGINVFEVRSAAHLLDRRREEELHRSAPPLEREGRGADVARAVAAIAEDLLDYSTGQVLHVDGGLHMRRL